MYELFLKFLDVLFPPRKEELLAKNVTYDEAAALVSPVTLPGGTAALLPYRHPLVKALIKEAKFKGNRHAQEFLGRLLAEYLQEYLADEGILGSGRYALQPVPLSKKRYTERGYNQAKEIAKVAAATLGLPVASVLIRVRDTMAQTSLSRAKRLSNMEGAFEAKEIQGGVTYLLIDDVATTGATMDAARAALPGSVAIALAH